MAGNIVPFQGLIILSVILMVLLIISYVLGKILGKKGKKSIGRLVSGLLLFLFGLTLIIGFWSFLGIVGPALSAEDAAVQEANGNFLNYNEGDLLTIRDKISRFDTVELKNRNYTAIWFESAGSDDGDFNVTFKGNIRESHGKGDLVVVFLEVVNDESSSNRETLLIHMPSSGKSGADKHQIWPSWIADLWFWIILIIGAVNIVLGVIGLKIKKPEEADLICPTCGGEPTHVEKYYCNTCSEYVEPVKTEKMFGEETTEKETPELEGEIGYLKEDTIAPLPPPPKEPQLEESTQVLNEPIYTQPPPSTVLQPEQKRQISEEPPHPQDLPSPLPPPPPGLPTQEDMKKKQKPPPPSD